MEPTQKSVFVFGNPDLPFDSLPLRLLPALREALPDVSFEVLDPNEEWDVPPHMLVVDTVVNLTEPQAIRGLDAFMSAPRMTCHDFDAYANLMFMKKLGKVHDVTVLGLPPRYDEKACISWLTEQIDKELQY
jgi:hypothetical protein